MQQGDRLFFGMLDHVSASVDVNDVGQDLHDQQCQSILLAR